MQLFHQLSDYNSSPINYGHVDLPNSTNTTIQNSEKNSKIQGIPKQNDFVVFMETAIKEYEKKLLACFIDFSP